MSRPIPNALFFYRALVLAFHDGDTFHLRLDLGFSLYKEARCRMVGINCPELATEAGKVAATYTFRWLSGHSYPIALEMHGGFFTTAVPNTWPLIVQSKAPDKYGRPLVVVWRVSDGRCLNDDLLADGQAGPMMMEEQRDE